MKKRILNPALMLLLLAGCAQKQDLVHKAFTDKKFEHQLEESKQDVPETQEVGDKAKDETTKVEVIKDNLKPAETGPSTFNKTGTADRVSPDIFKNDPDAPLLNFEDAKLYDVIYSLCELLGVNFIIDPTVKDQTVTINMVRSDQKLKTSDLFDLLLKLHDLTWVHHGSFISIVPMSSPDVNPGLELLSGSQPNQNLRAEELVMQIIPLRYVKASEVNGVIKEFLSSSARVYEEPKRNVLIIIDKYQHITKAMELIPIFDIDVLEGKKMVYYQLAHVDAVETTGKLKEILTAYGYDEEGGRVSMVPIESLNGMLVVAPNESIFKEIDFWISKFDKEAQYEDDQVFIYKVENTTAASIANTISQLFDLRTTGVGGGRSNQGASARRSTSGFGGGTSNSLNNQQNQRENVADNDNNQRNAQNQQQNRDSRNNQRNNSNQNRLNGNTANSGSSVAENPGGEGPLMIVDEDNNSLIFATTPRDYSRMYKTLKKLDILPRQVFLEVTVLSVSLSDTMNLGLNWNWNPRPTTAVTGGSVETLSSGFNTDGKGVLSSVYTYQVASGLLTAQVNALRKNGYANLLQQPHIMAIDNQSAAISVGTDIPIQTSTTNLSNIADGNGSTPAVSSNIQYRSTGVALSFTPHINANGVIRLEISLDISDPGNVSGAGAPPISQNSLQTEMIVRDSQTVVMGGLIFDQESWDKSTVPLLGRVPLLKHLFTDRKANNKKSELIVMITPRLVDNEEKSIAISKEFRDKILREFDSFRK